MADGVDAAVEADEPPPLQTAIDGASVQPRIEEL